MLRPSGAIKSLMPYLVVYSRGQVMERRPLTETVCIGRSAECELVVRDILLSRSHCRIEPTPDGWLLTDLASKNGTVLEGRRIATRLLRNGDTVRMGKTVVSYHASAMPSGQTNGSTAANHEKRQRPLDPTESLAGTVWGMTLEPEAGEMPDHFANPRPAPPLPAAYEREKIHQMLEDIASSSWDSIYAESRKPRRAGQTQAVIDQPRRRPARPARPGAVCLSLQVNHDVLRSFEAGRVRKRTKVITVLKRVHRMTPWIAVLSLLKAAA